ncbi:hypothetical protein AVEN_179953-1 [Araneus ventricosus]|uniref:Uncharacterized protein n=1 Tax=Araneus ventricosus TaxID=182803 RepID=A0A4Y2KJ36_ARAVE|nr:hypothetical protein AVEN_179953-1 [Araneus ventricosus]
MTLCSAENLSLQWFPSPYPTSVIHQQSRQISLLPHPSSLPLSLSLPSLYPPTALPCPLPVSHIPPSTLVPNTSITAMQLLLHPATYFSLLSSSIAIHRISVKKSITAADML